MKAINIFCVLAVLFGVGCSNSSGSSPTNSPKGRVQLDQNSPMAPLAGSWRGNGDVNVQGATHHCNKMTLDLVAQSQTQFTFQYQFSCDNSFKMQSQPMTLELEGTNLYYGGQLFGHVAGSDAELRFAQNGIQMEWSLIVMRDNLTLIGSSPDSNMILSVNAQLALK